MQFICSKCVFVFSNPGMCNQTENFLFTLPFIKDDPTNKVKQKVQAAAEKRIYNNQRLLANVANFKTKFLNDKECLIHGDLHTGSVMVKQGVPKVGPHLNMCHLFYSLHVKLYI